MQSASFSPGCVCRAGQLIRNLKAMPRAHRQQHTGWHTTLGLSLGPHLVVQGSIFVCPVPEYAI